MGVFLAMVSQRKEFPVYSYKGGITFSSNSSAFILSNDYYNMFNFVFSAIWKWRKAAYVNLGTTTGGKLTVFSFLVQIHDRPDPFHWDEWDFGSQYSDEPGAGDIVMVGFNVYNPLDNRVAMRANWVIRLLPSMMCYSVSSTAAPPWQGSPVSQRIKSRR